MLKKDFINKNKNKNIAVVGDVMLDKYIFGQVNRISPEAPVPVLSIQDNDNRVGGAANVAMNIAKMGNKVSLFGIIGDDDEGNLINKLLSENNIDNQLFISNDYKTTTKTRFIALNQQLMRGDVDINITGSSDIKYKNYLINKVKDYDLVVLSDYNKGFLLNPQELINQIKRFNVPILIDPKGADFLKYKGATILTPNFKEFTAVVGECKSEGEILDKGLKLKNKLELDYLLITRSQDGMTLIINEGENIRLSTESKEVYDVTGAGDTVIATIASCLTLNLSIEKAIKIANKAAAITIARQGTSSISKIEFENLINEEQFKNKLMLDQTSLEILMKEYRARGQKIVMTNGCFDILHPGHINYLIKAKALGDCLIVAINSDEAVKRLKGANRPINNLSYRATMLNALESVDGVISFSEDTPEKLYGEFTPDILVKGGDYSINNIVGSSSVLSFGGQVKVIDYLEGFSTTNIIERISKLEVNSK